jgi:L-lactate utilization protein LutC
MGLAASSSTGPLGALSMRPQARDIARTPRRCRLEGRNACVSSARCRCTRTGSCVTDEIGQRQRSKSCTPATTTQMTTHTFDHLQTRGRGQPRKPNAA